jgi:hypothetical protein
MQGPIGATGLTGPTGNGGTGPISGVVISKATGTGSVFKACPSGVKYLTGACVLGVGACGHARSVHGTLLCLTLVLSSCCTLPAANIHRGNYYCVLQCKTTMQARAFAALLAGPWGLSTRKKFGALRRAPFARAQTATGFSANALRPPSPCRRKCFVLRCRNQHAAQHCGPFSFDCSVRASEREAARAPACR